MRALRPGKLTIAALSAACRTYLTAELLTKDNPVFAMLSTSPETLATRAERLCGALRETSVDCEAVDSNGQVGGGSLPDTVLPSKAVALVAPESASKNPGKYAEQIYRKLMKLPHPVVGVLREGRLLFDLLTVFDDELETLAQSIATAAKV
jgi:L-seryl-tRNA(Ser) seleniumtransferase